MSDAFSPIREKCMWWREIPVDEDVYDVSLPADNKRIRCSCFVEGKAWTHPRAEVPSDCPEWKHCRYYIKHW